MIANTILVESDEILFSWVCFYQLTHLYHLCGAFHLHFHYLYKTTKCLFAKYVAIHQETVEGPVCVQCSTWQCLILFASVLTKFHTALLFLLLFLDTEGDLVQTKALEVLLEAIFFKISTALLNKKFRTLIEYSFFIAFSNSL